MSLSDLQQQLQNTQLQLQNTQQTQKTETEDLQKQVQALKAELKQSQEKDDLLKTTAVSGDVDPVKAKLVEDNEAAQNQISFLNNLIVSQQGKIHDLKVRLEAMEDGTYKNGNADISTDEEHKKSSSRQKPAPRLFCDICDIFDKHDTDDCPTQAMTNSPQASRHHGDRSMQRPYCETCEDIRLVEGKSDNEDSWHEATGDPIFGESPDQGKLCSVGRNSPKDEIIIADEKVGWTKSPGEFKDRDLKNKTGNKDLVASKKSKENPMLIQKRQDKPGTGLGKESSGLKEDPNNADMDNPTLRSKQKSLTSSNGTHPLADSSSSKKSSEDKIKGQNLQRFVTGGKTEEVRAKLPLEKQIIAKIEPTATDDLNGKSTKPTADAKHSQNNPDGARFKAKQNEEKDTGKDTTAKIKEAEKRPRPKSFPASMQQESAPPKEKSSGKARPTSVVADEKTNQNEKGDGCVIS